MQLLNRDPLHPLPLPIPLHPPLSPPPQKKKIISTHSFLPWSSMTNISFLSSELCCFTKILKTTPLFCNQLSRTWIFWISGLVQPCKTLKIPHCLIKYPFTLYFSWFHIARGQVTISLQVILKSELLRFLISWQTNKQPSRFTCVQVKKYDSVIFC